MTVSMGRVDNILLFFWDESTQPDIGQNSLPVTVADG